jgi:hypothetical protein
VELLDLEVFGRDCACFLEKTVVKFEGLVGWDRVRGNIIHLFN